MWSVLWILFRSGINKPPFPAEKAGRVVVVSVYDNAVGANLKG